ncbi:hypothetical protein D3C75_1239500 [compost metagenome]
MILRRHALQQRTERHGTVVHGFFVGDIIFDRDGLCLGQLEQRFGLPHLLGRTQVDGQLRGEQRRAQQRRYESNPGTHGPISLS